MGRTAGQSGPHFETDCSPADLAPHRVVDGDEAALAAFRIVGTWLGRGIADLAAVLDPAVFVLAGGVSSAGDLLREPAWQEYLARLTGRGYRPSAELRVAKLGGDEAGIIGAADLARQPLHTAVLRRPARRGGWPVSYLVTSDAEVVPGTVTVRAVPGANMRPWARL